MALFGKGKKKKDSDSVPNLPKLDLSLTVATALLFLGNFYLFYSSGRDVLMEYLVSFPITAVAITMCKFGFHPIGQLLITKEAGKQPRNLRKFADQSWQLVVHATMTCYEVYLLNENGWKWWTDTKTQWSCELPAGKSSAECQENVSLRRLYIAQLGIWFVTAFSHKFLEAKHKDYFVMYAHHVVTLGLVTLSYFNGWTAVGLVTLFIHDSSDIVLDLVKMINYLGLDSNNGLPLAEIAFIGNIISWFASRLWFYPIKVVKSTLPLYLGLGDYPLELSVLSAGNACRLLLITLQFMHIYWYYLCLRILYKIIKGSGGHDVARDEYEGSSDSEAEPTEKPSSSKSQQNENKPKKK